MKSSIHVGLFCTAFVCLVMSAAAQGGFGGGGMGGGGYVVRERMRRDRPSDFRLLEKVKKSDIVVVRGTYDHVETVLSFVKVPHLTIDPEDLDRAELNAGQLVIVNCPGMVSDTALNKLRKFVRAGGFLFTTDWCLTNVLEKAFPGFVALDGTKTKDDVIEVKVLKQDNELLKHVGSAKDAPKWWLESESYPIHIKDAGRVEVLIESAELKRKYGESPVAVTFREGDGKVLHIISHYYLQRTETRTAREKAKGTDFANELGVKLTPEARKALEKVSAGEARDAYSASQLSANVIIAKQKHNQQLKSIYTQQTKQRTTIRSKRPEPSDTGTSSGVTVDPGTPVKVIEKGTRWCRVQTYGGDEGWIERDKLTPRSRK